MFTGIIEALGDVISVFPSKEGKTLELAIPFPMNELTAGNSIAVNGVCLTLTNIEPGRGSFFLSKTTLNTSNLSNLRASDRVNLERPLRLSEELGGHIVTGHVDVTGMIKDIKGREIRCAFPEQVAPFIIPKGSIALDGISLTISSLGETDFTVTIIPHTWEHTNLKFRQPQDKVNIEVDLFAKYIYHILNKGYTFLDKTKEKSLCIEKLQESGFL